MLDPPRGGQRMWKHVLTVDPGLGGTGLAFWPTLSRCSRARLPAWTRVVNAGRMSWQERAFEIAEHVRNLSVSAGIVFIEIPRLWTGSKTSRASASRGDLTKLSVLAGAILHAMRLTPREIVTAFPSDWKGQLPKPAVDARIQRALGRQYPDHAADAVGMGLAIQGVLNIE